MMLSISPALCAALPSLTYPLWPLLLFFLVLCSSHPDLKPFWELNRHAILPQDLCTGYFLGLQCSFLQYLHGSILCILQLFVQISLSLWGPDFPTKNAPSLQHLLCSFSAFSLQYLSPPDILCFICVIWFPKTYTWKQEFLSDSFNTGGWSTLQVHILCFWSRLPICFSRNEGI